MNRVNNYVRKTNLTLTNLSEVSGKQGVYVLHFVDKQGNTARYMHAAHYTGYAKDLARRIGQHASGKGANLTHVIKEAGLEFVVAAVYIAPEGMTESECRELERSLKNSGGASRYCAVCKMEHGA